MITQILNTNYTDLDARIQNKLLMLEGYSMALSPGEGLG